MRPIHIIGMGQGPKDLTPGHRKIIEGCDLLIGGRRQLDLFKDLNKETLLITGHISTLMDTIRERMNSNNIVVLASGDPLYHGIGSTLTRHFAKDHLLFHTNISSVAAAFAAIKEPWHDAKIVSLHNRQEAGFTFPSLASEHKVAFLTGPQNDPHYIAKKLIENGLYNFRLCILENLGHETTEKISWFDHPGALNNHSFSHPNIVILLQQAHEISQTSRETHIGMDESLFRHSKGLITKSEIRSISLSKLKLIRKNHILWDIGSGSGSVGIEASFLLPWGHVVAFEKNPGRISDIIYNLKNFNCSNVKVLNSAFPEGASDLQPPDRIFIGGGGQALDQVITEACNRLCDHGVIVVNTVLLQNLNTAVKLLNDMNFHPEVVQIQVSRSKPMPYGDRFEALNPVWIISGSKPKTR